MYIQVCIQAKSHSKFRTQQHILIGSAHAAIETNNKTLNDLNGA